MGSRSKQGPALVRYVGPRKGKSSFPTPKTGPEAARQLRIGLLDDAQRPRSRWLRHRFNHNPKTRAFRDAVRRGRQGRVSPMLRRARKMLNQARQETLVAKDLLDSGKLHAPEGVTSFEAYVKTKERFEELEKAYYELRDATIDERAEVQLQKGHPGEHKPSVDLAESLTPEKIRSLCARQYRPGAKKGLRR